MFSERVFQGVRVAFVQCLGACACPSSNGLHRMSVSGGKPQCDQPSNRVINMRAIIVFTAVGNRTIASTANCRGRQMRDSDQGPATLG